jgi:hypothetical protein
MLTPGCSAAVVQVAHHGPWVAGSAAVSPHGTPHSWVMARLCWWRGVIPCDLLLEWHGAESSQSTHSIAEQGRQRLLCCALCVRRCAGAGFLAALPSLEAQHSWVQQVGGVAWLRVCWLQV